MTETHTTPITVLIRVEGQLFELGDVPIPDDAAPDSTSVAGALESVAGRIRLWRAFRDAVGPLEGLA